MPSKKSTGPSAERSAKLYMVVLPRIVAIFVLLVIAGAIFGLLMATKAQSEKKEPEAIATVVRTIESNHRPASRLWSGYGTARTMNSAQIVAEVGGRVVERPETIEAGERIEAGALIVRLDDTDYINALDSARQALKSLEAQIGGLQVEQEQLQNQVGYADEEIQAAKRDLERMDEAISRGVGSAGERDQKLASMLRAQRAQSVLQQQLDLIPSRRARLEAERSSQQANERIAKENLSRAALRAPFAGELQSVDVRVGDWAGLGTPVARLVDLSRLEIPLKVPASSSAWIKVGDPVRLWVQDPEGEPEQVGQVTRIAPEADSASRTMTVFVEVEQDPDTPDRLLPGQFVHGRVVTHDPKDRVILPRRAVQSNTVFVASKQEDGSRLIEIVPVRIAYSFESLLPELDPTEDQWVALESGYEPVEGSLVVVSLLDQMISGMRVQTAEEAQAAAAISKRDAEPGETEATTESDESDEVSP